MKVTNPPPSNPAGFFFFQKKFTLTPPSFAPQSPGTNRCSLVKKVHLNKIKFKFTLKACKFAIKRQCLNQKGISGSCQKNRTPSAK